MKLVISEIPLLLYGVKLASVFLNVVRLSQRTLLKYGVKPAIAAHCEDSYIRVSTFALTSLLVKPAFSQPRHITVQNLVTPNGCPFVIL